MPSTYSDLLRLEKQAAGENDSTWGDKANTVFEMIEDAIAGRGAITHDDTASYTLTTANSATDEARNMMLNIGGALTAARNVVVPTSSKLYFPKNATTGSKSVTVKTSAGTGIVVPNGKSTVLICDGTNVVNAIDYLDTLTVPDANFSIVDDADPTKIAKFQASGITTGNTRTYTLPDASTTLVGTDVTQTLTNKTLTAPVIATIKPSAGNTLTLPDATDTVVTLAGVQTLTNKTLTSATLTTPTVTNPDNTTQALTDGATINWNASSGAIGTVTLGGNRTLANPTNLKKGTMILKVTQDGTGSRTLAYGTAYKWAGGNAPVLSTAAGAVDVLTFYCDGTSLFGTIQKAFA